MIRINKIKIIGQVIGEKEKRFMKKQIKYSEEKIGKVEIVKDFLPKPEDLLFKESTVKNHVEFKQIERRFF